MHTPIRVAILTGGESSERDVALASAKTVEKALSEEFDVRVFDFPADLDRFLADRTWPDIAIPVFHGKGGEDGTVQGMLKTFGIPFLFSDVTAHAVGLEKGFTKDIVSAAGLRTAAYKTFHRGEAVDFPLPAVVKPVDGGSSIGISIVRTDDELSSAAESAFFHAEKILVEKFIEGEEFTVAVVEETGKPLALPVIQVKSKHAFFDYESKYDGSLAEEICPAEIFDELAQRLQNQAVQAHLLIGAKQLTRSDFIVDGDGNAWFLEINTIPGATLESLVPKAIRASGRTFGGVLAGWIKEELGVERG